MNASRRRAATLAINNLLRRNPLSKIAPYVTRTNAAPSSIMAPMINLVSGFSGIQYVYRTRAPAIAQNIPW